MAYAFLRKCVSNLVKEIRTDTLSSTPHCGLLKQERVPCEFGNLVQGCCPLTLLQSDRVNCVSHVKEMFLRMVENL